MARLVDVCLVAVVLAVHGASGQATPVLPAAEARSGEVLAALRAGEDPAAVALEASRFRDAVALAADRREFDALVDAEAAARIAAIVAALPKPEQRERLMELAADHDTLVRRLVFELHPEHDSTAGAVDVLLRLIDRAGVPTVAEFDRLAVAIAVVHDAPVERRINENHAQAADPVDLFGYFVSTARTAQIDPRRLPTNLLVFIVNATEHPDQLDWARSRYRADRDHGRRFFEIQYDIDHFRTGRPKAVSLAPRYCLQAIREHGGVCADQAYFAEHVAKSVGVPSAYMRGRSGEVSHAWLGYLTVSGPRVAWDFNAGRYAAYQGVRGSTVDPQTHRVLTDGELSMRASDARLADRDRWRAMALLTAADRIAAYTETEARALVAAELDDLRPSRFGSADHRLGMLEAAVAISPGQPDAWRRFAALASSGDVAAGEIDRWLRAFERSAGQHSADMLVDLIDLLLASVPEASGRIEVLEWAGTRLRGRSDLQAWVRLRQGEILQQTGDLPNAWRAYDDVTRRFINDGPFAVDAVDRMLAMLDETGRRGPDLELLRRTFDEAEQPFSTGEFRTQSNWYRLGERLADRLTQAGLVGEAKQLQEQLGFERAARLGG
ncbi:MAG: hypothetical protein ACTS22_02760 [Phycisphaerales bacterium]